MRREEEMKMQMRCSSADVFYEEPFADALGNNNRKFMHYTDCLLKFVSLVSRVE